MAKAIINGKLAVEQNTLPDTPTAHHLSDADIYLIGSRATKYLLTLKRGETGLSLETFNEQELELVWRYLWFKYILEIAKLGNKISYRKLTELVGILTVVLL